MKKSDLKTGMIVETRNGEKYLVMLEPECKGRELINIKGGWLSLSEYAEELNYKSNKRFDVIKVYSAGQSICHIICNKGKVNLTLLWDRKKGVLDKVEKEYLGAVIKPFRNSIKYIKKRRLPNGESEDIMIEYKDMATGSDWFCLPSFPKRAMYKGMKLNEQYTLEELGL